MIYIAMIFSALKFLFNYSQILNTAISMVKKQSVDYYNQSQSHLSLFDLQPCIVYTLQWGWKSKSETKLDGKNSLNHLNQTAKHKWQWGRDTTKWTPSCGFRFNQHNCSSPFSKCAHLDCGVRCNSCLTTENYKQQCRNSVVCLSKLSAKTITPPLHCHFSIFACA